MNHFKVSSLRLLEDSRTSKKKKKVGKQSTVKVDFNVTLDENNVLEWMWSLPHSDTIYITLQAIFACHNSHVIPSSVG